MNHEEHMKIGHAMLDYSRRFKAFMKSELSDIGLNFIDGMTLLSLYGNEGRTAEGLLEAVSCDKSVMTRTLQKLEKDGLVSRQQNPDDGRSWIFRATASGESNAESALNAIKKWSEKSFGNISDEEIKLLLELLLKL